MTAWATVAFAGPGVEVVGSPRGSVVPGVGSGVLRSARRGEPTEIRRHPGVLRSEAAGAETYEPELSTVGATHWPPTRNAAPRTGGRPARASEDVAAAPRTRGPFASVRVARPAIPYTPSLDAQRMWSVVGREGAVCQASSERAFIRAAATGGRREGAGRAHPGHARTELGARQLGGVSAGASFGEVDGRW